MTLLAIDPGPVQTAWLVYADGKPHSWAKTDNEAVLSLLRLSAPRRVAIEMIASYGMAVGAEVFATCVWIGRFQQTALDAGHTVELVLRREVKLAVCHSPNANDATIRQALIDRYGPGKDAAIGRKATPGPLYGMTGDCWAALALAVTASERA